MFLSACSLSKVFDFIYRLQHGWKKKWKKIQQMKLKKQIFDIWKKCFKSPQGSFNNFKNSSFAHHILYNSHLQISFYDFVFVQGFKNMTLNAKMTYRLFISY